MINIKLGGEDLLIEHSETGVNRVFLARPLVKRSESCQIRFVNIIDKKLQLEKNSIVGFATPKITIPETRKSAQQLTTINKAQ